MVLQLELHLLVLLADSETIEVKPKTARWEMSDTPAADCASSDPNDCRYWCYKGIPAEYTTVSVQRLAF